MSRAKTLFKRRNDRYKDSGLDAEGGLPTLRGGLPCSLPPEAYLNIYLGPRKAMKAHLGSSWCRLGAHLDRLGALLEASWPS